MAVGLTTQQVTWMQLSVELAAVSPLAAHGHLQAAGGLTAHGVPQVCDDRMVARLAEDLCRARLHRDMTAAGSQALARSVARHADRAAVQVDPEGHIVSAPAGWRPYKLDLSGTGAKGEVATTGLGRTHAPVMPDGKVDGGPINGAVPVNGKNHAAVAVGVPVIAVQTPSSSYQELVTRGSDVIQVEFSRLQAEKQRVYDSMRAALMPLLDALCELRAEVARNAEEVTRLKAERKTVGIEMGKLLQEARGIESLGGDLAGVHARLEPVRERTRDMDIRIHGLLMVDAIAAKEAEIKAAILPFEAPILALLQSEGNLVSWTVHAAVQFSDPENENYSMGEFYQHVAAAAQAYRGSVAFDEETGLKVFARALEDQGFSLGTALNEVHQTRVQLRDAMTLPETQRGRGQLYNVREELRALDLEGLADQIPDRIPLPVRWVVVDGVEKVYSPDQGFVDQPHIVQFYDLELRSPVSFEIAGEIMESDRLISVLTPGTGTANSTLSSITRWQSALSGNYGRPGKHSHARLKNPRRVSVIGVGEPFHGYGNRDGRLRAAIKEIIHPTLATMAEPDFMMRLIDAMRDRYAGYDLPMIFGGRSTGGYLARAHRLARQETPHVFDGYLNMSGFPFSDPTTLAYHILVYYDHYACCIFSLASINLDGLAFFVRLANSYPQLQHESTTSGTALVLNMVAGNDIDYIHTLPPNLNPDDVETKEWIHSYAERINRYFMLAYDAPDSLTKITADVFAFITSYRELLEQLKPDDGTTVDEFWDTIRVASSGLDDFFHDEQRREEQERPGDEARSQLHFAPRSYHNMIAGKINDDGDVEAARQAMFGFFDRVVAGFSARRPK